MLFSEPKIPQSPAPTHSERALRSFSALQRAENSSIGDDNYLGRLRDSVSVLFSEPKIPQWRKPRNVTSACCPCFSALQRAENSSICICLRAGNENLVFQCSSASRKFLNYELLIGSHLPEPDVSVLFSEPKIPQFLFQNRQRQLCRVFQCSSASRKFLN